MKCTQAHRTTHIDLARFFLSYTLDGFRGMLARSKNAEVYPVSIDVRFP